MTEIQEIETKIKKSDVKIDSMANVVSDLIKTKDALIEKQESERADLLKKIAELEKTANKNPVDNGIEQPVTTKSVDSEDVGTKADAKNDIAPKPSESQASIIAPAVKPSGSDTAGLSMENKADDDNDSEKKKEDAPTTDGEEKKDKMDKEKNGIKKSGFNYTIVESVRPLIKVRTDYNEVPTAYQMLKATEQGFGETNSAEDALVLMYQKMQNGDFGDGHPSGVQS